MRYFVATHPRFSAKKVVKLVECAAGPRAQEAIVTIFDEIELSSERRGQRRGERKGRAQTILQVLALRFGPVPRETTDRILAASEASLKRLTGRVLTAPTLEMVIGDDRLRAAPTRKPAARKRARVV
jgi:hypothetical protein